MISFYKGVLLSHAGERMKKTEDRFPDSGNHLTKEAQSTYSLEKSLQV